jgi:hypothetical protein
VSINEELHEHAEGAHDSFSRKAAALMATIAACLALVAVYGHLMTTEELLSQAKASDQWAYYQAKALRRYQSDVAIDILHGMPGEAAQQSARKYDANARRYETEAEQIMEKAKEYEAESSLAGRRALRLHIGEVFLELAIVIASLAILTRRRLFWRAAIASGAVGALAGASVFLILH